MSSQKKESFMLNYYACAVPIIRVLLNATTSKRHQSKLTISHLISAEYTENTTTVDGVNITYIYLNDSKIIPETTKTETKRECPDLKIHLCILEIITNETDAAIKLYHELHDYENYTLIYTIVKQAYANNTKNVPNLVSFIIKLPWCNHQYAGLEYLFNELKLDKQLRNPESIQFAYHLKKFLDGNQECLHIKDDKKLEARLRNLKDSFPDGIRFLIWNGTKLCLKSHKFDEFLYAAECCKYDGQRRRVFTWIPKGVIGTQGEWTFEPHNDATFFRIKNVHYQEYLYAVNCCKYDRDRRNVFTWVPKGDIGVQGEWTLELVNESNLFKIKSSHYNEYLYAAACCKVSIHDNERRSVFTWIPGGDAGPQGEWEIAPCT